MSFVDSNRLDLLKNFVRFGLSGCLVTLFYVILYMISVKTLPIAPSILIAYSASTVLGYLLHKNFSFRSKEPYFKSLPRFLGLQFFIVTILLLIPIVASKVSISNDLHIAIISAIVIPLISFLSQAFWVFK